MRHNIARMLIVLVTCCAMAASAHATPTETTTTVASTTATSATATTPAPAPTAPPAGTVLTVPPTVPPAPTVEGEPGSAGPGTWLLRVVAYLSLATVLGVLVTAMFVWPDVLRLGRLRTAFGAGSVVLAISSVLHLMVIGAAVRGVPWTRGLSATSDAVDTGPGLAMALRAAVAIVFAGLVLFDRNVEGRLPMLAGAAVALLATWAFSRPESAGKLGVLGVVLDVGHHAAAMAWIGGLACVTALIASRGQVDRLVEAMLRFGDLARACVAIIVVTGLVEWFVLAGNPLADLSTAHGKWMVVKLAAVAAMLFVASVNRQRLHLRMRSQRPMSARVFDNLRRAIATEFGIGVAVLGVTAMAVISPSDRVLAERVPPTTVATTVATTVPTSTTLPAPCTIGPDSLKAGAEGEQVTCLQRALIALRLMAEPASGVFDDRTDAAVRQFQRERSLGVDGVVGRITGNELSIWAP